MKPLFVSLTTPCLITTLVVQAVLQADESCGTRPAILQEKMVCAPV